MIYLFTDFGSSDLYVGQMKAALYARAPEARVIDLLHEVPLFDVENAAHLLSALVSSANGMDGVYVAVVDPGVGSSRRPVVMQCGKQWFVGPDNGLLSVVAGRAEQVRLWEILWRPARLSASFHGRDVFAPIAAMLASDSLPETALGNIEALDVEFDAVDRDRIVYVDHYGNAMSGIRGKNVGRTDTLLVAGCQIGYAAVFAEVPSGQVFWYENSLGLVEIAANGGSAAVILGLAPGMPVVVIPAAAAG